MFRSLDVLVLLLCISLPSTFTTHTTMHWTREQRRELDCFNVTKSKIPPSDPVELEKQMVALFKHSQQMDAQGCHFESLASLELLGADFAGGEYSLLRKGKLLLMMGNERSALELFRQVVQRSPKMAEAWSYLSFLEERVGGKDGIAAANRALNLALTLSPSDLMGGYLARRRAKDGLLSDEGKRHLNSHLHAIKARLDANRSKNPGNETEFSLVTAMNSLYFLCGGNLIGSIQVHEPNVRIFVFDLGLDPFQVEVLSSWRNVQVVAVDFDSLPPHVRNLRLYAWKPLVYKLAAKIAGNFFYEDCGQEVRGSLADIFRIIRRDGYFYVTQGEKRLGNHTHPMTIAKMGVEQKAVFAKDMCAGGIQGYRKDSPALVDVVERVASCVLDKDCIAPHGANQSNHRFDQSVFSIVLASRHYRCHNNWKFTAYLEAARFHEKDTFDVENGFGVEEPIIFSKRCGMPWPYLPLPAW